MKVQKKRIANGKTDAIFVKGLAAYFAVMAVLKLLTWLVLD